MAVRRPKRVTLPDSAFLDITPLEWPECVADLEPAPGTCWAVESVAQCNQGAADALCLTCTLRELGESLELLNQRTNQGIPKAKFYRDLARAQSVPDDVYRRMMDWKRRQTGTVT